MKEKFKDWILSESFIKRSVAVFIYYSVGSVIIGIPIIIILTIIAFLFG